MVKTKRQIIINEEKMRISPEEVRRLTSLNELEVDTEASSDEDARLPGFTRFGKDEFGIDDIQTQ